MSDQLAFSVMVGSEILVAVERDAGPVARTGDGCDYAALHELVAARPPLTSPTHLVTLCRLANFLTMGGRFRMIEDMDAFRARSERRLAENPGDSSAPWQDYGPFDLEHLAGPEIVGGELRFCVEDPHTGVPYRAHCPLRPSHGEVRPARYKILPYRSV